MPSYGPRTAEGLKTSCHLQCRNGLYLFSEFLLGALQIIALLQIEPEIRAVTAQLPEPQCQHCCHRLLFIKNVIERLTRHAEQLCDFRLWPIKCRQNLLAQKLSGMHGR